MEMIDNYGTKCMSVQLVVHVMNRFKEIIKLVIVKCCTGHGRVFQGLH